MDPATSQINLVYLNTQRQNLVGYIVEDNSWSFYPQKSAIYFSQVTLIRPLIHSATSGVTVTHKLQLKILFCKLISSTSCILKTTLKNHSFKTTLTRSQFKIKLNQKLHNQNSHHHLQLQKEGDHWAAKINPNRNTQHQHQQEIDV